MSAGRGKNFFWPTKKGKLGWAKECQVHIRKPEMEMLRNPKMTKCLPEMHSTENGAGEGGMGPKVRVGSSNATAKLGQLSNV